MHLQQRWCWLATFVAKNALSRSAKRLLCGDSFVKVGTCICRAFDVVNVILLVSANYLSKRITEKGLF